ncbi:hypothetical protein D3C76_1512290 [compost metagenome]
MRALDVQRIQQRQYVAAQLLDAVRSRRHQGLAMAAGVETQHAKMLAERRNLRVPHVQVSTQRVGQHQHRRIDRSVELRPLNLVVQFAIGELYESHSSLLHAVNAECSATARSTQVRA